MEIIKLNLIPSGVNPTCHAKQYDDGRVIRIELFDGLTPYTIQSGDTFALNVRKPDNTIVETSLTATQGNKYVDIVTTEQICAVVGYNLCALKITNGSVEIGTLNFIMAIERDVLANGIPSQSVIEDLDALVQEAVGDNYYTKTEVDAALAQKASLLELNEVKDATTTEKSEIRDVDITNELSLTTGFVEKNGTVYTGSSYENYRYTNKIPCNEGDVFKSSFFRVITAYKGENADSASGAYNVNQYVVPEGVTDVILTLPLSTTTVIQRKTVYWLALICEDDITELQNDVKELQQAPVDSYSFETLTPTLSVGYVNPTTGNIDTSSTNYRYTNKISCNEGDVVKPRTATNGGSFFRFVTFYKDNAVVSSEGIDANVSTVIIPDGVDSFIGSSPVGADLSKLEIYRKTTEEKKINRFVGHLIQSFDLASGDNVELPHNSVKNNVIILFNGLIDSFSSIKIGKKSIVTIDTTNITIGENEIPHGLTINHDLTVSIVTNNLQYLSFIQVSSCGESFKYIPSEIIIFDTSEGNVFVESVNTVMHDCELSWTSKNINKDIWIFGDSYVSQSETRWIGKLISNGYDKNCIIDGYSGRKSLSALVSVSTLLNSGSIPKIVIWALGMNDTDDAGAVNIDWNYAYEEMKKYAKAFNFELILSTIPLVQSVNNAYKNSIVRASGYRYIDFSAAVNTTGTNWISGALSNDGIHPTEIGAEILYCKAVSSVPELCTE